MAPRALEIGLMSLGVFIQSLSMLTKGTAIQIGGNFVAGTLFALGLAQGLLLLLAILQSFESAQPLPFCLPLLAAGGQAGFTLRDDSILLGNRLVQCVEESVKIQVV